MNLENSLKKLGIEQTFRYVFKDPETNMRKLMDWADSFDKDDCLPAQRKAIREAVEDPDHPYCRSHRRCHMPASGQVRHAARN